MLNCYAKLKDTDKLETFIKSGTNFDLDTAIAMCRQGGYYDQAVVLSKKHGEHNRVIDILIEDSKNYDDALDYIWRREPDAAYPNLMRYGRVLLEHCPSQATQLFIDYYTGKYHPKKDPPFVAAQPTPGGAVGAVQNLASFIPLPYRQSTGAPSPATAETQQTGLSRGEATADGEPETPLEYTVPKPRTAFSSFVDHPEQFIVFLEACLKEGSTDEKAKVDLHTTLFEIYLDLAASKSGREKSEWEAKAKTLIAGQDVSEWSDSSHGLTNLPQDFHGCIERTFTVPSVQLPRRDGSCSRATRLAFRHLPLIRLCGRYGWRY